MSDPPQVRVTLERISEDEAADLVRAHGWTGADGLDRDFLRAVDAGIRLALEAEHPGRVVPEHACKLFDRTVGLCYVLEWGSIYRVRVEEGT